MACGTWVRCLEGGGVPYLQWVVRQMARIKEDIHRALKGKQEVDRET